MSYNTLASRKFRKELHQSSPNVGNRKNKKFEYFRTYVNDNANDNINYFDVLDKEEEIRGLFALEAEGMRQGGRTKGVSLKQGLLDEVAGLGREHGHGVSAMIRMILAYEASRIESLPNLGKRRAAGFHLPDELFERLEELREGTGFKESEVIELLIRRFVMRINPDLTVTELQQSSEEPSLD